MADLKNIISFFNSRAGAVEIDAIFLDDVRIVSYRI